MNSNVSADTNSKSKNPESFDNLTVPVWLHATESFYKKLNRVAKQCGLIGYDALSRGLDALLRETEIRNSALNRNIKSPSQSEVFRRAMGRYRGTTGRRSIRKRNAGAHKTVRGHVGGV
jgi:hypothetical protein